MEKYKELRRILREKGIRPLFSHEYVENDRYFQHLAYLFCRGSDRGY